MAGYGETTANNGTAITIPPGGVWSGKVILAGSLSGAIGASGATAMPAVVIAGGDGTTEPPAGAILSRLVLTNPTIAALSLVGTCASASSTADSYFINNSASAVAATIKLQTGSATAASLVCAGILQ